MPLTPLTILTLAVPSRHASDAAYHPYARSALPTCLQRYLPSLPSQCPPDMPPTPLTILMLSVPSRHASNTTYHPYTHVVPSQPAFYIIYHPYKHVVPSRHASTTSYHPYAHVVPSQHRLPSLQTCSALPTCLECCPHSWTNPQCLL
ncbi:hypothetical protein O181_023440 [Austropuccinia psidii MF-1]|uniref:Uncharacterized protein n=1 Tax=Austropuccinia psidii MF-1 TaxID=1389203 RepID=A0A9Q3CIH8_9BASI|nr:hypothetical protein [Austropuccinia psidii MF-1]